MLRARRRALATCAAGILAVGCAGDSPSGSTRTLPTLTVGASSLVFDAEQHGDPVLKVVTLAGSEPVGWTAGADASWLELTPSSGMTPATINAVARPGSLTPGTYQATITITAPTAATPAQRVAVVLTVSPAPSVLVRPTSLSFETFAQATPAAQSISIDAGGRPLAWTAATSASWITASPASGTGSGSLSVGIDTRSLLPGTYAGSVTINVPGAANSSTVIPVALTVRAQTFTISATAAPSDEGTVTGAGTYAAGDQATLKATPLAGYEFVSWTEGATVVATDATYSFVVQKNRALVANFRAGPVSIATSSSPSNGGTTSGGGVFARGSQVNVIASPAAGFAFQSWTENSVTVSSNASYTFTASTDRTLVANFSSVSRAFAITALVTPTGAGTVSGSGTFTEGTVATVSASAASGYTFTSWTESGVVVSTAATYSFVVTSNRSLVANFSAIPGTTYTISASVTPAGSGAVTGAGTYASGATVSMNASPNSGYSFSSWTENGVVVSTAATYSFVATSNRSLVANFSTVAGTTYTISASVTPAGAGTVTGAGTYASGATVSMNASPNSGYSFSSWTENGVVVSSARPYTFTASANRSLVANFAVTPAAGFTVQTVSTTETGAVPQDGGTTTGDGTYAAGSTATVTAIPRSGFVFGHWLDQGVIVSTSPTYSFTVTSDRRLVAYFPTGITLSDVSVVMGADDILRISVNVASVYPITHVDAYVSDGRSTPLALSGGLWRGTISYVGVPRTGAPRTVEIYATNAYAVRNHVRTVFVY